MDEKTRTIALIAAVVLIAIVILFVKNPFEQQQPILPQPAENTQGQQNQLAQNPAPSPYPLAPEIIGIHSWINSEPLTLAKLRGQVVLVDFWTYSCINCLRTLPYLRQWHEKYKDLGLVIVGVHSPEFNFEKNLENVQKAVTDNEVKWPVGLDNDMSTWRNYRNRFWPAKYLVDAEGRIRYTHFGEGKYEETEAKIQELLEEARAQNIDVELTPEQVQTGGAGGFFRTRELYAGYAFGNYFGNAPQAFGPEKINEFTDQGNHADGKIYLHGNWFNGSESVRHAQKTQNKQDFVAIKYLASEVNIVVEAGTQPYKVFVELDGKKLEQRFAGADVQFDEEGNAFMEVTENRLYNAIKGPLGVHELKLSSDSDEFELYTFTFGG